MPGSAARSRADRADPLRPSSAEEAAEALGSLGREGRSFRAVGGGTKLAWGAAAEGPAAVLETGGLGRILEHNRGDLTAVLEAGVPLTEARNAFADGGQMLALDPPLGEGDRATVGGVVATGDAGPLRHRYGAPRDLLLGIRVALADGSLARSGGKVIKNVAGYDLAKLFAGSFGTLGLIVEVAVRLHPLPAARATAVGRTDDPRACARAASVLAARPLEAEALDVTWRGGMGGLAVRFGGAAGPTVDRAATAAALMEAEGLAVRTLEGDEEAGAWDALRSAQRAGGADAVSIRVSARPSALTRVIEAAEQAGAALVGRAGLGLSWLTFGPGPADGDAAEQAEIDGLAERIERVRATLAPFPCVVQDAPPAVRSRVDPWGPVPAGTASLLRRVKERFDPGGICAPGVFAAGI